MSVRNAHVRTTSTNARFVLAVALCLGSQSFGRTWDVPAESPTIGAALASCVAGDTVLVADGVYTGAGNCNLTMPPFDVVLRSLGGPEACTIDCEEQARWLMIAGGQGRGSIVEGFRVIHGREIVGGAICIQYGSPTIRNCEFEANHGGMGAALVSLGPDPLIIDCTFRANDAGTTGQGGAALVAMGRTTFVRTIFHHNRARVGGAIAGQGAAVLALEDCTIAGNWALTEGGAISFVGMNAILSLSRCIVYGNECFGVGDEIYALHQTQEPVCCNMRLAGMDVDGWTFSDCIDADPLFCDAAGWEYPDYPSDYHLRSDSPCLPVDSPCGALIGALGEGCLAPGVGACCIGIECVALTEADCAQQQGSYQGDGTGCDPNPCVPIPVERTTWGRIKARFGVGGHRGS